MLGAGGAASIAKNKQFASLLQRRDAHIDKPVEFPADGVFSSMRDLDVSAKFGVQEAVEIEGHFWHVIVFYSTLALPEGECIEQRLEKPEASMLLPCWIRFMGEFTAVNMLRTETFSECTVLVAGDVMLDVYVYGEVQRISPEAPIPVLSVTSRKTMPGGAANVAANVAALGATAILLGVIGDDQEGHLLRQLITGGQYPVLDGVIVSPGRLTTVKQRYICNAHQMLRADLECRAAIDAKTEDALIEQVGRWIDHVSIAVLSDYNKGVLTGRLLSEVLRIVPPPVSLLSFTSSGRASRNIEAQNS